MSDIQKTNTSVNWNRLLTIVLWLLIVANLVPLLWYGTRAFVADRFVIKGESMEPTLHTGEGVWVNKLLMGARIYTKFDFEDSPELHCFRMPGLRKLRVGDVAVFNYPYGRGGDTIAFKINYVYCKRCWGTPGDTVRIVDGMLETAGTVASKPLIINKNRKLRYSKSTPQFPESVETERLASQGDLFSDFAQRIRETPDSVLLRMRMLRAGQFAGERDRWTTKDFGPIVVPRKGMTIALDSINRQHYARVIDWEERCGKPSGKGVRKTVATRGLVSGRDPLTKSVGGMREAKFSGTPACGVQRSGHHTATYTFRQDWYFFVGDNVTNSHDSRFFGFVPADFVIGSVPRGRLK